MADHGEQVSGTRQRFLQGELVERPHRGSGKKDVFPRAVLELFEKNQPFICLPHRRKIGDRVVIGEGHKTDP
jgi:hypothetical protein